MNANKNWQEVITTCWGGAKNMLLDATTALLEAKNKDEIAQQVLAMIHGWAD